MPADVAEPAIRHEPKRCSDALVRLARNVYYKLHGVLCRGREWVDGLLELWKVDVVGLWYPSLPYAHLEKVSQGTKSYGRETMESTAE